MKLHYPAFALVLSISFSSYLAYSQHQDTKVNATVVDFLGQKLESGTRYYIFSIHNGTMGGGLTLASRDGTCPFYVMLEHSNLSHGLALRFSPLDTKQRVVTVSSDINIVFNAATTCVQSTVWKLGDVDAITGQRYVRSGGTAGRPGGGTVSNWFKIEKYGDGSNGHYKIVYCPSVCGFCKVVCGNVGVFDENGKLWLGISDEPLVVVFRKA